MSVPSVSASRRRLPNINKGGAFTLRFDHVPERAASVSGGIPLLALPKGSAVSGVATKHSFSVLPAPVGGGNPDRKADRQGSSALSFVLGGILLACLFVLGSLIAFAPPREAAISLKTPAASPPVSTNYEQVSFVIGVEASPPQFVYFSGYSTILKAAIAESLSHFIETDDVTVVQNPTATKAYHTYVNCAVAKSTGLIVKAVAESPAFVEALQELTGLPRITTRDVKLLAVKPSISAPSPPIPPGLPPPATPPPSSVYDCYTRQAGIYRQRRVLSISSLPEEGALGQCREAPQCMFVSRESSESPWVLLASPGVFSNATGAVTFFLRSECVRGSPSTTPASGPPTLPPARPHPPDSPSAAPSAPPPGGLPYLPPFIPPAPPPSTPPDMPACTPPGMPPSTTPSNPPSPPAALPSSTPPMEPPW